MSHTYHLDLTKDEYQTLIFCEQRGYSGGLLEHASDFCMMPDGSVGLTYSEAAAWNVLDSKSEDPDAFGACMTHAMLDKVLALVDSFM